MSLKKIYVCDCSTEAVSIETEEDNKGVYLSFWRYGEKYSNNQLCWPARIREALRILVKGSPYPDMVILDQKTSRELGQDLLDITSPPPKPKTWLKGDKNNEEK